MKFLKKYWLIALILLVGSVLRLSIIGIHSYSNDELSAITRLDGEIIGFDSFGEMLEKSVKTGDMHPAGVQTFMLLWKKIGGTSEFWMRLPFALCGILSIWITYRLGRKWINENSGVIAAAFLAVLYFPVIHSELARPYSPGLLFALLVGWYYLKVLFEENHKWKNAILLGVCFAAAMYTHYFAFLFVGFIGITGLFFLKKENYLPYLAAGALGILLHLPHFGITYYHLTLEGGLQWLKKPEPEWIFNFLFHSFNESIWLILILVILLPIAFQIKRNEFKIQKRQLVLFQVWFFGIYIVGHIFSLISSPVLKFPVMLFAFPFALLALATGMSAMKKPFHVVFVLLVLGIGSYSTIQEKNLYGTGHYGLFKEIAEPMVDWNEKYGKENIVTFMNVSNPNYLNFYAIPYGDSLEFDMDVIEYNGDIMMREILLEAEEDYCVVGYSSRLTLPQVFETAREFYPTVVESVQYGECAVFLLSKRNSGSYPYENEDLIKLFDGYGKVWRDEYWKHMNLDPYYQSTQANPFGPDYHFRLGDIERSYPWYLLVNTYVKEDSLTPQIQLTTTFTATRDGELVKDLNDSLLWIGHDLERMIQTSDRHAAYFAIPIPEYLEPNDSIQIGLWNRNGIPVEIYGIEIYTIRNIWNDY